MDPARWARLSPLLDELLDLDEPQRSARLAELHAKQPELADELEALLGRLPVLDAEAFLETPALPPEASLAGQVVGAYTLERELGQGGMGSVWLARRTDGRYEGFVAIKFLHAGLLARGDAERFAREGSILARLAHPHIARLIDAGVMPGGAQPYLVLEYIDGVTIERYCEQHALDATARVRLFLGVLAAVAHAHHRLILHRDLKPSNILVTEAGEVKLLDFGIATLLDDGAQAAAASELTQRAGRAFTPQYAAPEQLQGGDVTTATDVYALGVLLYVLLGGAHPTAVPTDTALNQLRAVVEHEPRRLSEAVLRLGGPAAARRARVLRGDLDTIVARALKKAPAERYANAEQLADDLGRYLNDEPIAARPDTLAYRLAKFVRRYRALVVAGSVTMLALSAGAGVALWEAREARLQRVQAEGLIEFMLGDLRKKLQPVGRLDVLDAVGSRALAYYAAQDADRLDADSLGRRARALHLIGEIAEQRGSLDQASKMFEQAAESTAELVQRHPQDGQRVFDHAQSVYWVGYIARRRGEAGAAAAAFEQYLALARRLVTLGPHNLDWRMESAHAGVNLGVVRLEAALPQQALQAFSAAERVWREVAAAQPEFIIELANTLGWVAKAREALGEYGAAAEAQRDKIEVMRQMPDAGRDRNSQRLLANASYELGRLQLAQGEYRLAAQTAGQGVAGFEALLAVDDSNIDWHAQAMFARLGLAEAQLAVGERAAARAAMARAEADLARLLATDRTRSKWNITLKGRLLLLEAALDEGAAARTAALQAALEAYLGVVQHDEAAGKPLDPEQTCIASAVSLALGDLLLRGPGDPGNAQAQAPWRSAAQRLEKPAATGDLPAMTLLAQARLRLGEAQDARALAEKVGASFYRHPAYADLRQRLAH